MASSGLLLKQEITVNGERRKYWLQKPAPIVSQLSEKPDKLPLVLVLHGAFMSSKHMMHFSQFSLMANTHHCLVAYPDMSYFWQWDVPVGFANKDAIFIEQLIDKLIKTEEVDPKRVYATGFSSGADILHLLACSLPLCSKIAAFAPVCSNLDRQWASLCDHDWPTSIMMINGTHDKFNKWDGDAKRWMSVEDTFAYWQNHNKISSQNEKQLLPNSSKSARSGATRAHLLQSFDQQSGSEVSLVTIEGGGHTFPVDRPDKWYVKMVLGNTHKDTFASSLIWDFFDRHQVKSQRQKVVS